MRPTKILLASIGIVFGLWSGGVCGSLRDCVTQTYTSQIGIQEATGHNDGVEVQMYLASCGLKGNYPWCAAFVNWTLKHCGFKTINDARASAWFRADKVIYNRQSPKTSTLPQNGDMCGFVWTGTAVQHIAFVDKWGSDRVITVEGNTSPSGEGIATRDGDGVFRKRRMQRTVAVASDWIGKL